MSGIVVSDSTAIIHLSRIHALDILKNLYGQIHIPQAVQREIARGNQPGALQIANLQWIKVAAVADRALVEMLGSELDAGESEAIALAVEKSASVLVIDERKGRKAAKERGVAIIGIAGILIKAKQATLISKVRPHLDELARTGFRLSDEVRNEVLRIAGELDAAQRA